MARIRSSNCRARGSALEKSTAPEAFASEASVPRSFCRSFASAPLAAGGCACAISGRHTTIAATIA
jgi:hypothetical protein